MIIKEYLDEHISINSLWETIENLRDGKAVEIIHIELKDEDEKKPFEKEKTTVENKSKWRFEPTPSAPLVYTARYVQ